jgi:hypothetical protein
MPEKNSMAAGIAEYSLEARLILAFSAAKASSNFYAI